MALFQRGQRSQSKSEPIASEVPVNQEGDTEENPIVASVEENIPDVSEQSPVIAYPIYESPAEEKIHELVEESHISIDPQIKETIEEAEPINGWHPIGDHILTKPSHNGMPFYLSDTTDGQGVLAYWKRTRAFSAVTKKFEPCGKWVDFITGSDIVFEPRFWRERFV